MVQQNVPRVALPTVGVTFKKGNSQAPSAFQKFNPSQRKVAMAMISHVRPLVVTHRESQVVHLTATTHRPTWNWKDVDHCCRTRALAECKASRLGRRSLERGRAEHWEESLQAQDRLQNNCIEKNFTSNGAFVHSQLLPD